MKYNIFLKKTDEYKEQQIALWKRNLQNIPEQRYQWFYEKNPSAKPITILAITGTEAVVGNCSLYQRDIMLDQSKVRIGIASDFAVDKKHRVFGPALKMQRLLVEHAQQEKFYFLFAFPNNNSRGLFERIGYERLGEMQSGIKILKSRNWIRKKIKPRVLNFTLSFLIDSSFSLYDFVLRLLSRKKQSIRQGFAAAQDYDDLWKNAKETYSIIGEKTARYLKWRYADNPSKDYQFINAYDKKGNLQGFIVFSVNVRQVILEEMFITPGDNSAVDILLSAFVTRMRRQHYEQIIFGYLGNKWILKNLKKHLFFIRAEHRYCLILTKAEGKDKKYLFNPDNWCLFESEMDI